MSETTEDDPTLNNARSDDAALIDVFAGHDISRDAAAHFRGRLDRKLLINRCADCAQWHQPPRPMCPQCWSWNVAATEVSGTGTIHLMMILHQGPPADGVDYAAGHPVITVELDEQAALRFTSTLAADPASRELGIGDRVELDWVERSGVPVPVFRAVGS